ncbi:oxidoreductase, short chain dehydrogenase/reductase family protein [Teladorsagia circumcincta]|uniref:Oxidoreductase, short chain dehydrogenase/reductase family protein n=1 Tax=Teladorsagia circumcincta TaxID=45464 RepID=A0A2G9U202_TELCI|nr:oxidoreductase, short chain dehydrogenase/reductase family protein [Teladorsagia circumcincta]
MGRFDGRAVIVTGSSNGIGRATAVMFAKEGAMVTICGRDEKTLNETKTMVLLANGNSEKKLFVVRGDLCKEEVMKETVDGTVRKFDRLDVLVNNAGGTGSSCWAEPEIEGDISYFDYTMNLNTRSVLRLCQLAFPHLVKSQGEIVNVSSVTGLNNGASAPFPFYSISKAAQDQLTRNLAMYYIKKGVRVNSVNPGIISTNIVQRQGLSDEAVKEGEERIGASNSCVPCGRAGTPDEVAEAILFLADRKRSSFIIGHQLVIDGGSSLHMPLIADGYRMFAEMTGPTTEQKA